MNKKWVVIVIVVILVVGIVAYLVGKGVFKSEEEKLIEYTEGTNKYVGLSKSVVIKYDVLVGEAELGYKIDQKYLELGMLNIDVSLSNKSQHLIKQTEADLKVLDGQGKVLLQKYILFVDLKPGETSTGRGFSLLDMSRLDSEPKKITITLWKLWGETYSTPPSTAPTASPTVTPKTTATPVSGSPSQVVNDFYRAWIDGRYEDMLKYVSSSDIEKMSSYQNWRQLWTEGQAKMYKERPVVRIETFMENEGAPGDKRGNVGYRVYYQDKAVEELGIFLVKEDSGWKILL